MLKYWWNCLGWFECWYSLYTFTSKWRWLCCVCRLHCTHVGGNAVYCMINLRICICSCWLHFCEWIIRAWSWI